MIQISGAHWKTIRHRYSEEEKVEMDKGIIAVSYDPYEFLFDPDLISIEMFTKMKKSLGIRDIKTSLGDPGDTKV